MRKPLSSLNPTAYNFLVDGLVFSLCLAATASWTTGTTLTEWLLLAFGVTLAVRLLLNWR